MREGILIGFGRPAGWRSVVSREVSLKLLQNSSSGFNVGISLYISVVKKEVIC